MSKIKNGALDQYGAEPFEQQQFGTAGVEGVKTVVRNIYLSIYKWYCNPVKIEQSPTCASIIVYLL